jgi:hypothetical protein
LGKQMNKLKLLLCHSLVRSVTFGQSREQKVQECDATDDE